MLILSRKVGEKIQIGDDVTVTVVRIIGGGVRLAIDAPKSLTIVRQELRRERSADNPPLPQSAESTLNSI
jgi:carbon storage regulator